MCYDCGCIVVDAAIVVTIGLILVYKNACAFLIYFWGIVIFVTWHFYFFKLHWSEG